MSIQDFAFISGFSDLACLKLNYSTSPPKFSFSVFHWMSPPCRWPSQKFGKILDTSSFSPSTPLLSQLSNRVYPHPYHVSNPIFLLSHYHFFFFFTTSHHLFLPYSYHNLNYFSGVSSYLLVVHSPHIGQFHILKKWKFDDKNSVCNIFPSMTSFF